jgi:hypothetical protein
MSIEQSIADLVAIGGRNLQLPQDIAQTATNQIAAVGAAYQARVASLTTTFVVNQATGSDTGTGTAAAPFRSIDQALSLTPRGGRCYVSLAADYTLSAHNILVDGKDLIVRSDSSVKRALVFERYLEATLTPNLRGVRGFHLGGGSLSLLGLTINIPVLDGSWGNYLPANSSVIGVSDSENWRPLTVTVYNCAVVIPAVPFCALFDGSVLVDLTWYANALTGAVTSLNGRILSDQPNTAGVATPQVPSLRTNLTTI